MYTRRLVQSGHSSHVISIPKEFLDRNKLKTGDMLFIDTKGERQLIVSPAQRKEKKEPRTKVIEVAGRSLHIVDRDIIRAYIKNYDEIIVHLDEPSQLRQIRKTMSFLFALEVVHEDNKKIIAKDFLNYADMNIHTIVRRIEHLVYSMMQDLKEVEHDSSLSQIITERDLEVNRIYLLLMRVIRAAALDSQLAEQLEMDSLTIMRLWVLNIHIEKLGDHCKRFARTMPELKEKGISAKKLYSLLDEVMVIFKDTFTAVYNKNFDLMDKNLDNRMQLLHRLDDFESQQKDIISYHLVSLLKDMLGQLADINKNYRFIGFLKD